AERKTCRRFRHDRRRVWPRFHSWSGHWRSPRRHQSAPALLGRGWFQPGELVLRLPLRSRIARRRASETIHAAPREPDRLARSAALASGTMETHHAAISRLRLARSFCDLGALRDLSL